MYRESRNNVKVMLKEAAINHLSDEVKVHKNNPGSFWKIINKTIPVKEKENHIYTKDLNALVNCSSRLLKILITTSPQLEKSPPLQH